MRKLLAAALSASTAFASLPARAFENDAVGVIPATGRVVCRAEVYDRIIADNVETPPPDGKPWCADAAAARGTDAADDDPCRETPVRGQDGYRLSVDGEAVVGEGRSAIEAQRCRDARLAAAGIRVQTDDRDLGKTLDLGVWPDPPRATRPARFTGEWNYAFFVERAELRLFPKGGSVKAAPKAVVPFSSDRRATWTPAADDAPGVRAVLRVYGRGGVFDETLPLDLPVSPDPGAEDEGEPAARERAAVYGKTRLSLDRIRVSGAKIRVSGDRVSAGAKVFALGRAVPVSPDGRFAVEEILPPGRHDVMVRVQGDEAVEFMRPVYVATDKWFYIALADVTLGGNRSKGPAALVRADTDHYEKSVFADGRAAFYLKGKVKGDWLLTASADTREQPLHNIWRSLDEKDPRYLLRRLDPDRYYPVYGDDSTMTEDAPTQGKFYVRLERGESSVLWGNSTVRLRGNELVQIERAMYGGRAHLVTDGSTRWGERRATLDGFVGDPGTLRSREEFRGTGGSLYYLQHLDEVPGSDLVTVEVRDKDSGLVLRTRDLERGTDYDVDPIQGRLVLSEPLPSTADDGRLVRSGDLSGHPVYLVARYDYQPGLSQIRDYTTGGRASVWLGDHLEVGATGLKQKDGDSGASRLGGADATLRLTPTTYVKGAVAQSRGAGPGERRSADGGFAFSPVAQDPSGNKANAAQAEAAVELNDLRAGTPGRLTGYWRGRERGYSAPGMLTLGENVQFGGVWTQPLAWKTTVTGKYDETRETAGPRTRVIDADLRKLWGERWTTSVGVRDDRRDSTAPSSSTVLAVQGRRTDYAGELAYDSKTNWGARAFAQGMTDEGPSRLRGGRYGGGLRWSPVPRWTLTADGWGARDHLAGKAGSEARVTERTTLYASYQYATDRTDQQTVGRVGSMVTGVRSRYTDSTSVYGEERWQHGTGPTGLTHAYGLDVARVDGWRFGLSAEYGTLSDSIAGDFKRTAATGSIGLNRKKSNWLSALEYREERGATTRKTWLTRHAVGLQFHPDWRLLTKLAFSISRSGQGEFFSGEYTEGVVGFAYRPVENDRLNALLKYTYFKDLASPGQLTVTSATPDYKQRSHVFSADATYDLWRPLSVGGKYALRLAQVQLGRVGDSPWFSSTAHLGIVRLDWHVVRHWDAVVEGRQLRVVEARDARTGALLGIYRHVGKNLRFGGGYNFTDFSDELTDLSYSSHGWFVNVLAKF